MRFVTVLFFISLVFPASADSFRKPTEIIDTDKIVVQRFNSYYYSAADDDHIPVRRHRHRHTFGPTPYPTISMRPTPLPTSSPTCKGTCAPTPIPTSAPTTVEQRYAPEIAAIIMLGLIGGCCFCAFCHTGNAISASTGLPIQTQIPYQQLPMQQFPMQQQMPYQTFQQQPIFFPQEQQIPQNMPYQSYQQPQMQQIWQQPQPPFPIPEHFLGRWRKFDGSFTVCIFKKQGLLFMSLGEMPRQGTKTNNLRITDGGNKIHFNWNDLGQNFGPSHFMSTADANQISECGTITWYRY